MAPETFTTPNGITVSRTISKVPYQRGLKTILRKLDAQRGIYLSSGYEFPERYSRWDVAANAPPLEIIAAGRDITFNALNERGEAINRMLHSVLRDHPHWESCVLDGNTLRGHMKPLPAFFSEEERSKQPSAFTILRALIHEFQSPITNRLALVGAFGYDLLFQFDPIQLKLPRQGVKDLHLFLCDDIYFMDRKKETIERYQFDFTRGNDSTVGKARTGAKLLKPKKRKPAPIASDHTQEQYMAKVQTVREGMRQGDYYEVILRQTFRTPYAGKPSELFERIQVASPSPYEFFLQLGEEQLIGASPEMFVRVENRGTDWRVETCPISGTARRTGDPMRDADSIRDLLVSTKEESELTMCTDVDRNDKSRVCVPGTVKLIARRLIERYAGLFHTVDHVEGILAPEYDSLDAFLTHMWAVTLVGAPKKWAAQAIENLENDARAWYGGAVGMITLSGEINTGITIRTANLKDGVAAYSTGATILYDSDPASEYNECHLKATGFFRALNAPQGAVAPAYVPNKTEGSGVRMLLVDNEDCFIHTLANYARQTGAEVITYRTGFPLEMIEKINPSVILVSPGPGRPSDFGVPDLVRYAAKLGIPTFGVCLGLQGMVEAFGGELGVLGYPMHGKPSPVKNTGKGVFEGLPETFRVGRYHSLYAIREKLPSCFEITAETEDGIIMGVRHRELPLEAVQFHPESILTLEGECGLRLMENVVRVLGRASRCAPRA